MGDLVSKLVFKTGFENTPDPPPDFFVIKMIDIDGNAIDFGEFRNKFNAFLIVNVASRWGLTDKNYKELVRLDQKYQ